MLLQIQEYHFPKIEFVFMKQKTTIKEFSFNKYAWRQFKKNKLAYGSFRILVALVIIALLCPVLANDKPLYIKYKSNRYFPAFSFENRYEIFNVETGKHENIQLDIADWKRMDLESVVWAPVVYSPNKSEKLNRYLNAGYKSPGGKQLFDNKEGKVVDIPTRFRHWLGTNKKGEDVLAGLIYGTRTSLLIGIVSMGIASIIGLILGALAGYYGDNKLTTTRGSFWLFIIGVMTAFYYGFIIRSFNLQDGLAESGFFFIFQCLISSLLFTVICLVFYYSGKYAGKIPGLNTQVSVPVDLIISRVIEMLISIPRLILIISIAAITSEPSVTNVMLIIGLTSWAGIARITRAEFLRVRELEYIESAKALGYSEKRIIFRHALPNCLAPAVVVIAFGVASAILIESGLSFLGIGLPHDVVTWGSLLSAGKENFDAWWLVIFPGLAIFLTVTIYNLIGDGMRDALDPRLKS